MKDVIMIGYDPREHDAYEVCKYSLKTRLSSPSSIDILPLKMAELRHLKMFDRPYRVDHTGRRYDDVDGLPFSTEFSFTRFLAPHYAKALGYEGKAFFVDCDFVFLQDARRIFALDGYGMWCTKHKWENIEEGIKMDNQIQQKYPRKLWSSMMLFDLSHKMWDPPILSIDDVNMKSGTYLHSLEWAGDFEIGEIPLEWNYIPGFSPPEAAPKAIHYSMEAPWFNEQMHWVKMFAEMKGAYE